MIWRLIHFYVALSWASLLAAAGVEIFQQGEMARKAVTAGHYETSFVMWMTSLLALTVASATRGFLLEDEA